MSIIWKNSTRSGLCDRLCDLLLMLSYARFNNKKLKLKWEIQPFHNNESDKLKPSYRMKDYLLENLKKYINLPHDIFIVNYNEYLIIENHDLIFHDYLGGIYSYKTFYEKYICYDYERYKNIYLNLYKEFSFNFNYKYDNLITIHLRRTDRVIKNNTDNESMIDHNELFLLDEKTEKIIEKFLNYNYTNLYFCSDDINTLEKYKKKYNSIHIEYIDEIEKTYLDLYMLATSKYIILSQKHSNFSTFAKFIGNNKLLYPYEKCMINNIKLDKNDNFILFSDFLNMQNI